MRLATELQMSICFLLSQMVQDHLPDFADSSVLECRARENAWGPSLPIRRKYPQRAFVLSSRSVSGTQIFTVRLVDRDAVDKFDNAALNPLKLIAGPGN